MRRTTPGAHRMHAQTSARWPAPLVGLAIALVGCAVPASAPGTVASTGGPEKPTVTKRLVAAQFYDPAGFHQLLTNPGGTSGRPVGLYEVQELMHAGLSYFDDDEALRPRLTEAVPSAENGLWT